MFPHVLHFKEQSWPGDVFAWKREAFREAGPFWLYHILEYITLYKDMNQGYDMLLYVKIPRVFLMAHL